MEGFSSHFGQRGERTAVSSSGGHPGSSRGGHLREKSVVRGENLTAGFPGTREALSLKEQVDTSRATNF